MAKPEWGTKRICLHCGEHFYDLRKNPLKCPHCGNSMSVEEFLRLQLAGAGKTKRVHRNKSHEEIDVLAVEDDFIVADEDDDELELIEDASDLGDDNHDMAEVIENIEKGDE